MNKKIACYYTFEECCILRGGVNEIKKLVIDQILYFQRLSIEDLAAFLKKYDCNIITNYHYALSRVISCTQHDFRLTENISRFESCSEYFEQLRAEGRVIYNKFKLKTKKETTNGAIQLLVMATMDELVGEAFDYSKCFAGEPRRDLRPGWRRV